MSQVSAPDSASAAPRYCFLLPDLSRPMGGQAIIYDSARQLHDAGYDVAAVHGRPAHRYSFTQGPPHIFHLPALAALRQKKPTLRDWPTEMALRWREARQNPRAPRFVAGPRDVYILPEFAYTSYATLFPDAPTVMIAQDSAAMLRSYTRDTDAVHSRLTAVLTTSEASAEAVRTLLHREPLMLRLAVPTDALRADHPKKLQIAYMPRKLRPQSRMIARALMARPAFKDVPIIAIANMTNAERNQVLNDSLIFLSFSNMEGFGLPPAEAMAAGCIVVGYTGVGGNEYFTSQTGFPIEHHDMISFVRKTEDVVTAYRNDPAPLDALRQQAAAHIRATYAPDISHRILLEQWRKLDTQVRGQMDLPPL